MDEGERALCETLGYPEEELLGRSFQDITHPDDLDDDLDGVRRLLSGELRAYRKEKRYFREDGQTVWALLSISIVRDEAGEALYFISQVQDVTERKKLEEKLSHLAYHDPLTGLPNRTLLEKRLGHAFDRSERTGTPVAVLYMDLDGFKEVNDSLGHEAGDRLLVEFARRTEAHFRPADTVARLGGDAFCVLLEDVRGPGEAVRIADRLREPLTEPFELPEGPVRVGVSIGVAEKGPGDEDRTVGRLLCEADAKMYRAKKAAKSRPHASSGAASLFSKEVMH